MLVKAGTAGKATIKWTAKGGGLALPNVGVLTGPVEVRLRREGGDEVCGATFGAPFQKQDAMKWRDASD